MTTSQTTRQYITCPEKYPFQKMVREFGATRNEAMYAVFYGGGKTYLSLCWLADRIAAGEQMLPAIVLVGKSNISDWVSDIQTRTTFTCAVVQGDKVARTKILVNEKPDIFLMTCDSLTPAMIKVKNKVMIDWTYPVIGGVMIAAPKSFIVDESTKFKDNQTLRFQMWERLLLHVKHRLLLTGDPTPETEADIWAQMLLLDHGATLGKAFWKFRADWFTPGPAWDPFSWTITTYKSKQLADKLKEKVIRVSKSVIANQLPTRIPKRVYLTLSPEIKRKYDEVRKTFALQWKDHNINFETQWAPVVALKAHQLLQGMFVHSDKANMNVDITNDDAIDTPGQIVSFFESAKLAWLKENVPVMLKTGPIIIFTRYTANAERLAKELDTARFFGKYDEQADFKSGKKDILVLSWAKGYAGLNLQRANQCVLHDIPMRSEHFWNGIDRCWRIGSEHHQAINYYFLTMLDTVEDTLWTAIRDKKDLLEILLKQLEKI